MLNTSMLKILLQRIYEMPFWIKHIVYFELKDEMESSLKKSLNFIKKENCLQLYVPKMTFIGKKKFESESQKFEPNMQKFLNGATQNLNIAEIAINNGWNLAECSSCFINALNIELVAPPENPIIKGTALYLKGDIRLGEYFIKIGKITIEQLDETLKTQKYLEESIGDKVGIGKILINLGFVTKIDTEAILILKQEAQKRYFPEVDLKLYHSVQEDITGPEGKMLKLREMISLLNKENNQLKDQINTILKIKK